MGEARAALDVTLISPRTRRKAVRSDTSAKRPLATKPMSHGWHRRCDTGHRRRPLDDLATDPEKGL